MKFLPFVATAVATSLVALAAHAAYVVQPGVVDSPDVSLTRTTYMVSDGSDPLDQFRITRVQASWGHKPLILHAPLGYDVDWYQIHTGSEYRKSFLGSLARLGFDVWVVDDRLSRQAPGYCEQNGCQAMLDWTLQTRIDDSRLTRQLLLQHYPSTTPIVIGGFSGGALYAQAVVNAFPDDYVGLFLWNGTLVAGATQQAYSEPTCQLLDSLVTQGLGFDPSPQILTALYQLLSVSPSGLSPFANSGNPALQFLDDELAQLGITSATNQDVFYVVHTQHLNNPNWATPGFFFFQGDLNQGFAVADTAQVLQVGSLIDSYGSVTTLRDIHCALAGDTTYTDSLSAFTGSVFALGTAGGLGPELGHALAQYTNAETLGPFVEPAYGEADRYFHLQRTQLVDIPFANWAWALYH